MPSSRKSLQDDFFRMMAKAGPLPSSGMAAGQPSLASASSKAQHAARLMVGVVRPSRSTGFVASLAHNLDRLVEADRGRLRPSSPAAKAASGG
jgi:hypothetical protein